MAWYHEMIQFYPILCIVRFEMCHCYAKWWFKSFKFAAHFSLSQFVCLSVFQCNSFRLAVFWTECTWMGRTSLKDCIAFICPIHFFFMNETQANGHSAYKLLIFIEIYILFSITVTFWSVFPFLVLVESLPM